MKKTSYYLKYITRDNLSPNGKEKVFLSFCFEDYDTVFEKITSDIFSIADVAIYYLANEKGDSDQGIQVKLDDELIEDLQKMRLFIFAVTERSFINDQSPQLFVLKNIASKKPYIPIMLDQDLLDEFGKVFGDIQFLDPYGFYKKGDNEIPYLDRLGKRFREILVNEEEYRQMQKAFRARCFISYRKVDRTEAQALIRLIHEEPECQDIAVWYDEYLTPGEDFNHEIQEQMELSDIIVLNVTQNLLEINNGKKNYVMELEYPNAKKSGKPVISVEMDKTDLETLRKDYANIDDCLIPLDKNKMVRTELLKVIDLLQQQLKDKYGASIDETEKKYYIGLAYLSGRNAEVDPDRAEGYMLDAAENGLIAAMKRLSYAYKNGEIREVQLNESVKWMYEALKIEADHLLQDMDNVSYFETFCRDAKDFLDASDDIGEDDSENRAEKTFDMIYQVCRRIMEHVCDNESYYDMVADFALTLLIRKKKKSEYEELMEMIDAHAKEHGRNAICKAIRYRADAAITWWDKKLVSRPIKDFYEGFVDEDNSDVDCNELLKTIASLIKLHELEVSSVYGNCMRIVDTGLQYIDKIEGKKLSEDLISYYRYVYYITKGFMISRHFFMESMGEQPQLVKAYCSYFESAMNEFEKIYRDLDKDKRKEGLDGLAHASGEMIRNAIADVTLYDYYMQGCAIGRRVIDIAKDAFLTTGDKGDMIFVYDLLYYNFTGTGRLYEIPGLLYDIAIKIDEREHTIASRLRVCKAYYAQSRTYTLSENDQYTVKQYSLSDFRKGTNPPIKLWADTEMRNDKELLFRTQLEGRSKAVVSLWEILSENRKVSDYFRRRCIYYICKIEYLRGRKEQVKDYYLSQNNDYSDICPYKTCKDTIDFLRLTIENTNGSSGQSEDKRPYDEREKHWLEVIENLFNSIYGEEKK